MMSAPAILYTAAQVRELDRITIEERGVPGIRLMKRAGRVAFETLLDIYGRPPAITVYCGAGNNGGDGYIVAALAAAAKLDVRVVQVAPADKLKGDARLAYELALAEGVEMASADLASAPDRGVVVDAMLGTGLKGDVRADAAGVIGAINTSGLPVLAVDIPSGLCADSGRVLGAAVEAEATVTFIGRKRGLYTGSGPALCGEIFFDDLAVAGDVFDEVPGAVVISDWAALANNIPRRRADAHKGLFGHVMIVGGDLGFGGAAILAAEAALRSGAGLVSVATRPEHVAGLNARCPEVMAVGITSGQQLEPLLARPDVLVVGPGLGRTPWSEQLLQKSLAAGLPMVIDADALNILGEGRVGATADLSASVMTPHPGEAARLLGCSSGDVQRDRFAAVTALVEKYRAVALLKGAGTLIKGEADGIALCPYGNPGMAAGGMGDVLSGIIGALLAQGLAPQAAAETGAALHGAAGDRAAADMGFVAMAASDVVARLAGVIGDATSGARGAEL